MATMCGVEYGVLPFVGGQRLQTAQDRRAAPPDGDEPDAALIQFREFRVGRNLGIKVEPLGISACDLLPKLDKAHRLSGLIAPGQVGVGIAQDAALLFLGEEAQYGFAGLATLWQVVLLQSRRLTTKRNRMKVQCEALGLREQQGRHSADPTGE